MLLFLHKGLVFFVPILVHVSPYDACILHLITQLVFILRHRVKEFFLHVFYGGPQVSRQNSFPQGKIFFLKRKLPFLSKTKLSFSRQNFLSHGKTFFLRPNFLSQDKTFFPKAKLSFSRQNFLSQDKTFFLKAKLFLQDKTFSGGNQKGTNSMLSKSCHHGCC